MYCPKCGNKNQDGAQFCGKCGSPLTSPQLATDVAPYSTRDVQQSTRRKHGHVAIVVACVAVAILAVVLTLILTGVLGGVGGLSVVPAGVYSATDSRGVEEGFRVSENGEFVSYGPAGSYEYHGDARRCGSIGDSTLFELGDLSITQDSAVTSDTDMQVTVAVPNGASSHGIQGLWALQASYPDRISTSFALVRNDGIGYLCTTSDGPAFEKDPKLWESVVDELEDNPISVEGNSWSQVTIEGINMSVGRLEWSSVGDDSYDVDISGNSAIVRIAS